MLGNWYWFDRAGDISQSFPKQRLDSRRTTRSRFSIQGLSAAHTKRTAMAAQRHLLPTRYKIFSVSNLFAQQTRKTLKGAKIHAEIQLLFHCELQAYKLPLRVICSNKDTCFFVTPLNSCTVRCIPHAAAAGSILHGDCHSLSWCPCSRGLLGCLRIRLGGVCSAYLETAEDHVSKHTRVRWSRCRRRRQCCTARCSLSSQQEVTARSPSINIWLKACLGKATLYAQRRAVFVIEELEDIAASNSHSDIATLILPF